MREPEPRPTTAPAVSLVAERFGQTRLPTISTPVMADGDKEVVLGLFLEVLSMELTPSLRMGAIRARPSTLTVSLHVASPALRAALPQTGFQLGALELDRAGHISALRVIPTVQPFKPLETRSAFQIGGVSIVPENSHERLQLTPGGNAPMRMHLLANLELAGVELSSTFQIAQIVLKARGNNVRVTLNPEAASQEQTGATCQTGAIQLDGAARLAEVVLTPVSG
jgi:hypothetical protein